VKSIMVGIRFKEDIYQALQARVGQGSVADYIRELVTSSVNTFPTVNTTSNRSAIATKPVKPVAPVRQSDTRFMERAQPGELSCGGCAHSVDHGDHGRLTCMLDGKVVRPSTPACDKMTSKN